MERHPKQYIHAIYGSTETLLFEHVDRVILAIDWASSTFTYVSKRDLLADLQLSTEQFLDLGILAGFEHCPTFPTFASQDFSFKAALSLMLQFRSGAAAVITHSDTTPAVRATQYPDHFARAKCLIKQSLVLVAERGQILPLPLALAATTSKDPPAVNLAEAPSDLHEVFSNRLPDLVFFQQWRGLTGGTALNVLASGFWIDETPLCGGTTDDYKRFLKETLTDHPQGPRTMAIGLISSALSEFWKNRPVVRRAPSFQPCSDDSAMCAGCRVLFRHASARGQPHPARLVADQLLAAGRQGMERADSFHRGGAAAAERAFDL
jgi:hypothetical protein